MIEENKIKFGASALTIAAGKAPEALAGLIGQMLSLLVGGLLMTVFLTRLGLHCGPWGDW